MTGLFGALSSRFIGPWDHQAGSKGSKPFIAIEKACGRRSSGGPLARLRCESSILTNLFSAVCVREIYQPEFFQSVLQPKTPGIRRFRGAPPGGALRRPEARIGIRKARSLDRVHGGTELRPFARWASGLQQPWEGSRLQSQGLKNRMCADFPSLTGC